jgi:asparagine N-glycosylation enzyme membrane subunit Stt3
MLTFFIFYETCVGAFWLVGPAPGRATDVDVVRVVVVAVAAVLAELIALGMILGARWRARIDFSIIGHSMHLGFGGRGEATETHPH